MVASIAVAEVEDLPFAEFIKGDFWLGERSLRRSLELVIGISLIGISLI
jgi:hypothetical protein